MGHRGAPKQSQSVSSHSNSAPSGGSTFAVRSTREEARRKRFGNSAEGPGPTAAAVANCLPSLPSLDTIDGLSINELRQLLVAYKIDFTGCVEKSELKEKVRHLVAVSILFENKI